MTIGTLTPLYEHGKSGIAAMAAGHGALLIVIPEHVPLIYRGGTLKRCGVTPPEGNLTSVSPAVVGPTTYGDGANSFFVKLTFSLYDRTTGAESQLARPWVLEGPPKQVAQPVKAHSAALGPYEALSGYITLQLAGVPAVGDADFNTPEEFYKYPSDRPTYDSVRFYVKLATEAGLDLDANWYLLGVFLDPADPEPEDVLYEVTVAQAKTGVYAQPVAAVFQRSTIHTQRHFRPREGTAVEFWEGAFWIGGSSGYESGDAVTATTAVATDTTWWREHFDYRTGLGKKLSRITLSSGVAEDWWEGKRFVLRDVARREVVILGVESATSIIVSEVMDDFTAEPFIVYGGRSELQALWPVKLNADLWMGEELSAFLESDDGGEIVGLARCSGGLAIYKWGPEPKIFLMQGRGIPYPTSATQGAGVSTAVRISRVTKGVGSVNHKAIIVGEQEENYFFGGKDGFFVTDGLETKNLSGEMIGFMIETRYDAERFNLVEGWRAAEGIYEWAMPLAAGGWEVLGLERQRGTWFTRAAGGERVGVRAIDADMTEHLYFGLLSGRLGDQGGFAYGAAGMTIDIRRELRIRQEGPVRLVRLTALEVETDAADWTLTVQAFVNENAMGVTAAWTLTVTKAQAARLKRRYALELARTGEVYQAEVRVTGTVPTDATYFRIVNVALEAER